MADGWKDWVKGSDAGRLVPERAAELLKLKETPIPTLPPLPVLRKNDA